MLSTRVAIKYIEKLYIIFLSISSTPVMIIQENTSSSHITLLVFDAKHVRGLTTIAFNVPKREKVKTIKNGVM